MRAAAPAVFILFAALGAGEMRQGIKPRADMADYPARVERGGIAIGAALLSPDQVRHTFASDLNRGYVVVEVAIQPKTGSVLEVLADDFTLRIAGAEATARPASPRAIAAILQKDAAKQSDVAVYPHVGIGYESGSAYDPVTGTRRARGVNTSVGVGVGVGAGGPRSASTDQDRRTMELELSEKGLPEGPTSKAVASYLYFPLAAKKKGVTYELDYRGDGSKITLRLPQPPAK